MTDASLLGPWLKRFLGEYLVSERNLARNTQLGYRDTLVQLLPFVAAQARRPLERLAVTDLTAERVRAFLTHVEQGRGCLPQTRNQRLSAIRALARFVASRDPERLAWAGQVRAIPLKKTAQQPVGYLEKPEIEAMLAVPDPAQPHGRREHALLLFLYNTGARVSEAAQLRVGDLRLGDRSATAALATLRGKGGKTRQCPLWPRTARLLEELVAGQAADECVFKSRQGRPFTRFGIRALVRRCAARAVATAPSLAGKVVGPHVIRHTTATHLLRAGVDLNTIRAWLGHAKLSTTNIYAEIDVETKAKAIARCDASESTPSAPWRDRKDLMQFLRAL